MGRFKEMVTEGLPLNYTYEQWDWYTAVAARKFLHNIEKCDGTPEAIDFHITELKNRVEELDNTYRRKLA